MTDEQLLEFNRQGFIPGPLETEEEFLFRVEMARNRCREGEWVPRAHLDWVRMHLKEIFDFEPECLPVFYSNQSLAFWQGAASWIENGKIASVQLREALRKGSYWGYQRDEILAHEAVHAARSAFEEPKSEEFFAYMVSEKWWQRAFGPIVQRPWEVWPFLFTMIGGMVFPAFNIGSAIWLGLGGWRLVCLQMRFRRAGRALSSLRVDKKNARAILFRLTDREISMISRGGDLIAYAKTQACLRWRLIRLAYLDTMDFVRN